MPSVLVVGASGLVGSAAIRCFAERPDWRVRGMSRRTPDVPDAVELLAVDLEDAGAVAKAVSELGDVTHLVYAALHERPSLYAGWFEREQMETNRRMLDNLLDPLLELAAGLQHITLLQGTKAYGAHFQPIRVPAREREPRVEHENFYWLQEDSLLRRRQGARWRYTILRPQIVFGDALGVAMNPIPTIGAYAALKRERGEPLAFPGGPPVVLEAVDADLLGHAIAWAAEADAAADQVFNVTNGDVFVWQNVWPAIADVLGMETGPHTPLSLAEWMPGQTAAWDALVRHHQLVAPDLVRFAGQGSQYADFVMATAARESPPPAIVSTVKLRAAGFHEVIDTEDMFTKWFRALQERRLLPAR